MKKETCQIKTEKALLILAKKILSSMGNINTITMSGSLGSGKTTFTKYFAKELKIKNRITSPSFVLLKLYKIDNKKYLFKQLCHIDFYRTNDSSIQLLKDYLNDKHTLTIIEWPEKIKKLPRPRLDIKIDILKNDYRKISIIPRS